MATYTAQIQALYVAYFNRPADAAGLAYWDTVITAMKGDTSAVSKAFAASAEYKTAYANMDAYHTVATVYQNLFGHQPDLAGLNFWGQALLNNQMTVDNVVTMIAKGAQGTDLAAYNSKVSAATAFTAGLDTPAKVLGYGGDAALAAAKDWMAKIVDDATLQAAIDPAALASAISVVITPIPQVTTHNLTTGIDTVVGGAGNDIINAVVSTDPLQKTATALDSIDGGAGTDTLKIADLIGAQAIDASITIKNVENIELASAAAAVINTTSANITGLNSVKVTQGGSANVTAGSSTAVTVAGVTGGVTVSGGSTQTVAAKGGVMLDKAAGAVVATDSAQGIANSVIKDGTSVSLTSAVALDATANAAGNHATNSMITIGAPSHLPSGAVTVVENVTGDKAGNASAGDITVNGGTTVTVTQNATQANATASTTAGATTVNNAVTQAAVAINGGASTTTVVVNQTAAVAEDDTITAQAAVVESSTVKFGVLKSGDAITFDGLTFTAARDLTAADVAAAFANLKATSTQGSAPIANGSYTGTYGGNWTTGAVATDTVTFSSTATTGNVTDLTGSLTNTSTNSAALVIAKVADGVVGVDANAGNGAIVDGVVAVVDAAYNSGNSNSIKDVTLNAYATGSSIQSDALAKLSLANAKDAAVSVYNHTAAALDLSLNGLTATTAGSLSTLNLDATGTAKYTSLAVHANGANSTVNVTAAAVQTLTVDGAKSVNLTGSTLTALKTVTVSGAAGVTAGSAFAGANVTDVNASATSGTVSATIDTSLATYEGGSGTDTVTMKAGVALSKAVSLGAGDDTMVLASGTTTLSANIDGGAGTDTLKMDAADAATASQTTSFSTKFTGFEKLSLGALASSASASVDLSNMNNINYVVSANGGTTVTVAAPTALAPNTTQGVASTSTETSTITFNALSAGQSYTVAGRTVTATASVTAAAVATAFSTGTASTGLTVSGSLAGWTAGTVSTADVTFTSTTANTNVTDIVTSAAGSTAGALTLTKMADMGTLELTGAGAGATVTMKDATGTADTFNVVTKMSTSSLSFGTVDVAGVETVNLTATDTNTSTTTGNGIQTATITLKDAALKTLNISGNAHVSLSLDAADTSLTKVDGSAATGKLTIATVAGATAATTVVGGSANDTLTANHSGDVLQGGAGNDVLIVHGDLVTLTGGAGSDTFNVANPTSNVNAYATITDLGSGDIIKFGNSANVESFASAKVTLGDTAVFQDYANAAINSNDAGGIVWFQYGGNTYVVEHMSADASSSFVNGQDIIVKIAGVVDLSGASFNGSTQTLVML
jgi:S-layer protein